jgi:hypothetical protein
MMRAPASLVDIQGRWAGQTHRKLGVMGRVRLAPTAYFGKEIRPETIFLLKFSPSGISEYDS